MSRRAEGPLWRRLAWFAGLWAASVATIGAVASKVLDWDGNLVDYVDGSLTWFGMGYKREAEQEDRGAWNVAKDVLFPTGAAMFVPRHVYEELGGFDDRYFMFYAGGYNNEPQQIGVAVSEMVRG